MDDLNQILGPHWIPNNYAEQIYEATLTERADAIIQELINVGIIDPLLGGMVDNLRPRIVQVLRRYDKVQEDEILNGKQDGVNIC